MFSIIMPYYNRFKHLSNTLVSFKEHYSDLEYEVLIVEDFKNQMDSVEHINLHSLIEEYEDDCNIKVISYDKNPCYNPAEMFNIGVEEAKYDRIVLTNPECFHESNILKGLESYSMSDYIVCACASVVKQNQVTSIKDFKSMFHMWYIHSQHYPRKLHFCSCISKDNYKAIGGFDEEYLKGIAYEDDDFALKVEQGKINIVHADELIVLHQDHSRQYGNSNYMQLLNVNKAYFNKKWGRND